jgi:hypothetical protein
MTISNSSDRDDEIDLDDDQIDDIDDDDEEDRPKPKGKGRQTEPDDEDDEDEEPDDGWAAEAKRLRAALKKSNATGLRRRNQLKALKAAESKADDEDESDEDDDEEKPKQKRQPEGLDARAVQRQVDKARNQERKRLEQEHARDLIDTRAETALTRAGVPDKYIRLLKKELDYDDLELLKDRTVDGLEEEIDRLKGEFPDFFRAPKGARRRINGGDDRGDGKGKRPQSVNARQLALRGNARQLAQLRGN